MFTIDSELLPPPHLSWKKVLAGLPEDRQNQILDAFQDDEMASLVSDWFFTARREQFTPQGNWFIWLILAGRGFGKNWVGSNWISNEHQFGGAQNSAVVARTASDLRRTCIEGPSGIMAVASSDFYPEYKPSLSKLVWPNGTETQLYTADKPEKLRGPNHDRAWCDELSYWRYMDDAWDNLMMTLRYGIDVRCIITMTPRPLKAIKELLKRDGKDVIVTRGSTLDNQDNLSPKFIEQIKEQYYGTRLWQQEVEGAFLEDMEGALWNRSMLDKNRRQEEPESYIRKIISVDPSTTGGEDADECGIVVAGLGRDKHAYILNDLTLRASPRQWATVAVRAYFDEEADLLVAEKNQGGEMIKETIHSIDDTVNVKLVHASRGKDIRAEPVASLDEQGRIHHVGMFPDMEDEMCVAWNTHVLTPRGNKLICTLKPGDYVITREGPRKIIWSGHTGINVVQSLNGLELTNNHPVLCNNTFIPADQVKGNLLKCNATIPSYDLKDLMSFMMDIVFSKDKQINIGKQVEVKDIYSFIATFGNMQRDPYLETVLSTTKIETELIMESKTWNALLINNIKQFMDPVDLHSILENSVQKYQKLVGKTEGLFKKSAIGVETSILPVMEEVDIVANHVLTLDVETAVSSFLDKVTLTWNLKVEDCPEFFANNILVHNCSFIPGDPINLSPNRMDARVWAIHELMLVRRKRAGTWGRRAA